MEDNLLMLDWIPCIYYLIWFKKNKVQALINFGSKVNVMTPAYLLKLGLKVRFINIKAQKINGFIVETFEMILASFQIEDKLSQT